MMINQITSLLYQAASLLRWVKAGQRAAELGSIEPIVKRAGRVALGRMTRQGINKLLPPSRSK